MRPNFGGVPSQNHYLQPSKFQFFPMSCKLNQSTLPCFYYTFQLMGFLFQSLSSPPHPPQFPAVAQNEPLKIGWNLSTWPVYAIPQLPPFKPKVGVLPLRPLGRPDDASAGHSYRHRGLQGHGVLRHGAWRFTSYAHTGYTCDNQRFMSGYSYNKLCKVSSCCIVIYGHLMSSMY